MPRLRTSVDLGIRVLKVIEPARPVPDAVPLRSDPHPGPERVDQVVDGGRQIHLLVGGRIAAPSLEDLAIPRVPGEGRGVEDGERAGPQTHRLGEMGGEATRIVDSATGDDQPHETCRVPGALNRPHRATNFQRP